jgi:hypothetical protein
MRPGQLTPNALERAILLKIAAIQPNANLDASNLHVLSREYTGVGSFTNFRCANAEGHAASSILNLPGTITVTGVQNGLGAHLVLRGGIPECLEIYTFGSDHWDGTYETFSLPEDA